MSDLLTAAEIQLFRHVPETELVALAAELDIPVPEVISRTELLSAAVVALAQLARREGLPMSQYDRDDLEALDPDQLQALSRLCGVSGGIDALIKAGEKVYRAYNKRRRKSPIPLFLPMLLRPLARHANETEASNQGGLSV